jgi:DNA/RNA endonuclease YhcR with UshA esterase domain
MKSQLKFAAAPVLAILVSGALSLNNALADEAQVMSQTSQRVTQQATQQNINQTTQVTAQDLNQNPGTYLGKQVTITGRVDRVLGNGSYIIADGKNAKDPSRRILIFTSSPTTMQNPDASSTQNLQQQAGVAGTDLKEGDAIKLSGKVEEFNVSSEVDTFTPKSDVETIRETAATTPVVVIKPGQIAHY